MDHFISEYKDHSTPSSQEKNIHTWLKTLQESPLSLLYDLIHGSDLAVCLSLLLRGCFHELTNFINKVYASRTEWNTAFSENNTPKQHRSHKHLSQQINWEMLIWFLFP